MWGYVHDNVDEFSNHSARLVAAENALELEREKTASRLECQAGRFEVEKMQLDARVCSHGYMHAIDAG